MKRRQWVMGLGVWAMLGLACGGLDEMVEELAEASQPIPPPAEHLDMVGVWGGGAITLIISPEGMLEYSRVEDGNSSSFSAPILGWSPTEIKAGIGPIQRTFAITPPAMANGVWTMTVDGQALTRQD